MESNEENIQATDEPSTNALQAEVETTSISLLTVTNNNSDSSKPQENNHTEEEEKANDKQDASANAEIKSVSSSGSKASNKSVSAKLTPRSGKYASVKQDVRAYLEEKVFPILTNGLEELLKAVDDRNKKLNEEEEEEIPEINPLFFLARYLMRNAPQHSESNSSRASSQHSQSPNTEPSQNLESNPPSAPNEEASNSEAVPKEMPDEV
ncbi:hypothetical protein M9Y10_041773 [Tritrichomonas musculus]|uniref:Uncharacterized protein n=1 Tax=Tritrichomonas musculus TaxID=1915356 RepID=A0ABR2K6A8_9EUKA